MQVLCGQVLRNWRGIVVLRHGIIKAGVNYPLEFLKLFLEDANFHDHEIRCQLKEVVSLEGFINREPEFPFLVKLVLDRLFLRDYTYD